ncbi:MAG: putative acyl-CoA dehydrogenase FadE17 [Nitrosomonadaceae bacterium]|jgi:alkylation response protein AidB-like acyl-CoA dehydrogenase|nr:putative acyl-CoA dehydrogenase FadE17 [Nitrosomonadaceae bacterium]
MDLNFSAADNEFREQVRSWLAENKPTERRPRALSEMREFDLAWQRLQYDAGWAGIGWPSAFGGRDLPLTQQLIWYEEYARTGLPPIDSRFVGISHAGPTLIARGNDEQRSAHLEKILRGDVIWCQGFSEPEAGSDLASLRTRGIVDGEHLIVSGQKIWTSFAPVADYQELLIRTNPDVPKHKGITWVICDMHLPGIDVRPIRTLDNGHEFAEVFYDEVRIPLSSVVGDIDNGWSVAMSTLSFERGTAFTISQVQLSSNVERLIELAASHRSVNGRPMIEDDSIIHRLARARADVAALRALTYLNISRNVRSPQPGPEGSMLKVEDARLLQEVCRLAIDILGPRALELVEEEAETYWVERQLLAYSSSIGGGTSEIQKNIIAERVLGLPR